MNLGYHRMILGSEKMILGSYRMKVGYPLENKKRR